MQMKYYRIVSIVFLFFIVSCGGGGGSTESSNETPSSGYTYDDANVTDINKPLGKDLTKASATLKEIDAIANIQKIEAAWLIGEWASYDSEGVSFKATFQDDGTYKTDMTIIKDGKSTIKSATGKWFVYQKEGVSIKHLFLTDDSNPLSVEDYPLEQEGPDGFRILHSYKNRIARSSLYSRLSTDIARYPGMFLLGSFRYLVPASELKPTAFRELTYTLRKDGTIKLHDKYDEININSADIHRQNDYTGTWTLDVAHATLNIDIEGQKVALSIRGFSTKGLSLSNLQNNASLYWERVGEGKLRASVVNMEGEYQSKNQESYFSIRKNGDGYLIDYVDGSLDDLRFFNTEATVSDNGDLHMIMPAGANKGEEAILRAGYNRLIIKKGFTLPDSNLQKVSNHPIAVNNESILGTWRSALYSNIDNLSHMLYASFFKDGTFIDEEGYGNYTFDGQQLQMKKTCQAPKVYTPFSGLHTLKMEVSYSPVPGLRDWGEEGSKIGETLLKHSLDAYQTQNSPKLKPHPTIKGAYLFEKETEFSALLASENYISYTLGADGKGTYHTGNLGATGYDYNDNWTHLPGFGLAFGIKYFIVQEKGKEYIVYYPQGIVLIHGDVTFDFIDEIKNNNKGNVKIVELYHRRTAICEHDSTDSYYVVPLDKN
jgi:hypothetical protein